MRNLRRATFATLALVLATVGLVTTAGAPAGALPLPPPTWPEDKGALTWGANDRGQLGDGSLTLRTTPAPPLRLTNGVVDVAAGHRHTLAARVTGVVMAWGGNSDGQLGEGTFFDSAFPVQVSGLTGVIRVAAGDFHSLALRSDGTVWAWGDNSRGQLGDGTTTDRRTPVKVIGLTDVVEIAAGGAFSLARRVDGTVQAWGANDRGQLGDGTLVDRRRPDRVVGLPAVIQVAAGNQHALALRFDGLAFAWGANTIGALGDGTFTDRSIPVPVTATAGITHIAAGTGFTVAVSGGEPIWWGLCEPDVDYNEGSVCAIVHGPGPHATGLIRMRSVAAGGSHMLAVGPDGALWSWGENGFGQLGDGSTTSRANPVRIFEATGAVRAEAGDGHTVVLVANPPVNGL